MRRLISIGSIGLSACVLLGCTGSSVVSKANVSPSVPSGNVAGPGAEEPDPSQVAMTPEADLSPEDRAFLKTLGQVAVGFGNGVAPVTVQAAGYQVAATAPEPAQAPRYATQAIQTIEATVTSDGLYTGPFPASGSLPADYQVRPTTSGEENNWLPKNPIITSTCTTETTETHWTPDGGRTSPTAYTKRVVNVSDGKVTQDLYKAPYVLAPDLPAYFKAKVTLPATYTVRQTEETYQVHSEGGSALGYYWQAKDSDNRDLVIVQAFQVTKPGATPAKVNRWVLFGDYRKVSNAIRPTRYAYQTYNEALNTAQLYDQYMESASGRWIGEGSWTNRALNKSCRFTERIEASGQVTRVYTYEDATQTVVTTEEYKEDGSGKGSIKAKQKQGPDLSERELATTKWNKNGDGYIEVKSGKRPHKATRRPPAPPKGC